MLTRDETPRTVGRMRLGSGFTCPKCAKQSPWPSTCPSCDVPMQDEDGQSLPVFASTVVPQHYPFRLTWRRRLERAFVVAAGPACVALAIGFRSDWRDLLLALAVGVTATILALAGDGALQVLRRSKWEAERVATRLRVREGARAFDEHPLSSIAAAEGSVARIRGRVRVLRPTSNAGDVPVAAELTDEVTRSSGRFAVVDETGMAVVDDDALELWSTQNAGDPITIRDGDTVEVLGRGQWREVHDVTGGYRGGKQAFVFDGDAEQPVHVRLQPADEQEPLRVRVDLASTAESEPHEAEEARAAGTDSARPERRAPRLDGSG